jgi:Domain of unknown function (DUF4149)
MTLLRYVAIVACALWVGGLVALGAIGAPTLFAVLEGAEGPAGRELAGLAFGAIFERFQYVAIGLGLLVGASIGVRAAIGPRPTHFKLRLWTVIGLILITGTTAFVVAPRIDAIRRSVTVPIASLAENDARRVTFGRLHGLANALMVFTVLAGLGLLWAETTDHH